MAVKEQLLRIEDVALELNVSQKIIRKHIHSGALKSTKTVGVHYLNPKDVKAFVKSNVLAKTPNKPVKNIRTKSVKTDDVNWVNIAGSWENPSKTELTSADLFCGAGGMAKGFEMAGFTQVGGLDWFKEAGMTYRENFNHPHILGDITEKEVKDKFIETVQGSLKGKPLTVLSGGFPCQGFSMSGSRIVEDERNSLYKDMLEIIDALQPEFIVAENVKGLRSMLKGKVEDKIKEDIAKLGYNVNVTVLNAANYYVPQKRERIIFVANRIGKKNYHPNP